MTDLDTAATHRRLKLADRLIIAAIVCSVLYAAGKIMLFVLDRL